jgi:hypothetical protein
VVLGVAANIFVFVDSALTGDIRAVGVTIFVMMVIGQIWFAASGYWSTDKVAVVFFVASLIIDGACCVAFTINFLGSRDESPTSLDVAGKLCSLVKRYDGRDPDSFVECVAVRVSDGDEIDLDVKGDEAINPDSGADVELSKGLMKPVGARSSMRKISADVVTNGVFGVTYRSCVARSKKAIDLPGIEVADMSVQQALCVKTDNGRTAIMQVAFYEGVSKPGVFTVTVWKSPG